jgi:ABC-type sugar transport system ATPase subunit
MAGPEPGVFPAMLRQAPSGPAGDEPVLSAEGVAKRFGPTQALRDCSLDLRPGEVHVLMGENGSGKSTLVKILSGVHRPDAGSITVSGRRRSHLATPREAIAAGIATVFQEILVAPQQPVLANLWLGSDGIIRRRQSMQARRARGAEAGHEVTG